MNASPLLEKAAAIRAGKLEVENEVEILPAPGAAEAEAIRQDHATATSGMRAFVRMGFRLMDVKSRLPHGKYVAWCKLHLADLSERHLHRAKFIAESLVKSDTHVRFEELPPEILAIIDGASGIHALLAEVHEFSAPAGSELDAKKACEARWERKPEERDDWEPRVLSGEMNYHRALTGMMGRQGTAGKPREKVGVFPNLNRAANLMKRHFGAYDEMTDMAKTSFLVTLTEAVEKAPGDVKKALLAALK